MTPKIQVLADGKPLVEIRDIYELDAVETMYKADNLIPESAVISLDPVTMGIWVKWRRSKDIHEWLDEHGMDADNQRVVTGNATMVGLIGLCTVITSLGTNGTAAIKADMAPVLPFATDFMAKIGSGTPNIVDVIGMDNIITDTYNAAVLAATAVTTVTAKG